MSNPLVALLHKLVVRAHWVSEEEAKEASRLVGEIEHVVEPTEQAGQEVSTDQ